MEALNQPKDGNTRLVMKGAGVYPFEFTADHQTAIGELEAPTVINFSERLRWRKFISFKSRVARPYISRVTFPGIIYFIWDSERGLWLGA